MNQMAYYFSHLLSQEGFLPRWFCGKWTPFHGWLYILGDLGIWSAYFAIPIVLLYFLKKRADLPFSNLLWLFAVFILACGTSHLLDAIMFWWPGYRLLSFVDVLTAVISWVTVVALLPIIPQALTLKTPQELEAVVKSRTQELEAAEERYRLVVGGSNDGIWDWDLQTDKRYWSERLYEILGRKPNSHPLSSQEYLELVHPDDREKVNTILQAHLQNPEVQYRTEIRLLHADGNYRYCLTRGVAQRDSSGKPFRMAGMITDITALKESEQQLQETTERLSQSNRDLSQFATIASHDLKAPLRKVSIFHHMIQDEARAKLSPETLNLLDRADESIEAMQVLISDLLSWASLTNKPPAFQRVSLEQVLRQVQRNLELMIKETEAIIEAGSLPTIEGDETQLVQLFQNLVENGLKYQPIGQIPRVQIISECFEHSLCQITVQDNGIGFKSEYAEKIFQPFQRLHGKSSPYKGTGIGLSICQRIVERHGGSIKAESQEGQGSTFKILLPVIQDQSAHLLMSL